MRKKLTLPEIKQVIVEALKSYQEIVFAILYGSVIEGEDYRDIDLALFVDHELESSGEAWDFAFRLAEGMEKKLLCAVDVCILNDAPLVLRYHVCQGLPLLVCDEALFDQFIERTRDEYWDFQPIAQQYLRDMR